MPYLWFALILVCWGMVGCGSDGDSASSPVTVVLEMGRLSAAAGRQHPVDP